MSIVRAHYAVQLREIGRYPSFTVPTLLFPALFFLVFVRPRAHEVDVEAFLLAYSAFALLGVVFFQFGVGIAVERERPWERYLRTLPAPPTARFAARVATALTFGAAATGAFVLVAVATTQAAPAARTWPAIVAALLLGAIPLSLLGIALGYLLTPRGALPVANLLYLGLAYAGGLWTTDEYLPDALEPVSLALPTRRWAELLWSAGDGGWSLASTAWLTAFAACFGAVAVWAYRRDEGQRFR